MQIVLRLFTAFCVATVIAQAIILGMSAAAGNLDRVAVLKGIALINGVDISGDQLKKILEDARNSPNPSYEEVEEKRARLDLDLDMRERSINNSKEQMLAMQAELTAKEQAFEKRINDFYELLDQKEQDLLKESLRDVQLTLESLSPEQAKDQLLRMIEADRLDDVVAITKGMSLDKRKRILGEFVDDAQNEPEQLHNILMRLLQGEPAVSVIDTARDTSTS